MRYKNFLLLIASILTLENVTAQATEIPIAEGATVSTIGPVDGDSFLFTGTTTGTLAHDDPSTIRTFGTVATNNDGVGVINITSIRNLIFDSIGSATKKIDRIDFNADNILLVNGNIYTTNGIISHGNQADITLDGAGITIAGGDMGSASDLLGLVQITINSDATFYNNLFFNGITVFDNGTATLYGNGNSELGSILLGSGNSRLNINGNTSATDLTTSTSSTLTIGAATQLTLSDSSTINGTLGIGIDNSASGSAASITSTSDITVGNGARYSFDYSAATHLEVGDAYDFLTTSSTLTVNGSQTVTGNSFLLTPTVTNFTGSNGHLLVTQTLNTTNRNSLSSTDQTLANYFITSDSPNIDNARTALFRLSTASEVEESLATLQDDRNNMIQRTAMSVSSARDNMIDSHLTSINYQQFFSAESFDEDLYEYVSAEPEYQKEEEERNLMLFKINGKDYRLNKLNITRYKVGYDSKFYSYNELASFSSKSSKNSKKPVEKPEESVKNVWGEVFTASTEQNDVKSTDSTTNVKGYKANYGGVIFGLDKVTSKHNTNSILGAAFTYSLANAKSKSRSEQKTDITSYHLSLYDYNISKNGLGFVNENVVGVGYNQYDSSRSIRIGSSFQSQSTAKYSGIEYNAKVGFGYNFQVADKAIFSPIASIKYFGLQLQDYQETNPDGLALKVQNDRFDLFTSEIGFKFIDNTSSTIKPQINISWLHNLNTEGSRSNSSFVNGASDQQTIQSSGIDLDPDILNLVTQVAFESGEFSKIILKYDFQKSDNFTSYLWSIKFNLEF